MAYATKLNHKILEVRDLTDTTFVLRFERNGIEFEPGQYITVGKAGDLNRREYSVYSAPDKEYLEILVKEISTGYLTPLLRGLKKGDNLSVEGPFGFFTLPKEIRRDPLYFLATGTGISPFHCFVKSYDLPNYTLLHGIRNINEQYEQKDFDPKKYLPCISRRSEKGCYKGRVTDWLSNHKIDARGHYFLCGSCDMIYEVYDILKSYKILPDHIHAEVYF